MVTHWKKTSLAAKKEPTGAKGRRGGEKDKKNMSCRRSRPRNETAILVDRYSLD